MIREEIIGKINAVMSEGFEIPSEKLLPQAELKGDLGLDSLDAVDMLVMLEENMGTKVEGERLLQVKTLGDVYNLVIEQVKTTTH
jgi:acyl carrier protein